MKKKALIAGVIMIIAISSIVFYNNYARKRVQYHVNMLNNLSATTRKPPSFLKELEGKVELQRVIKQSPGELIMLVKWGDEDAFVSIENWLGKHTGMMKVRVFDKGKGFNRY